MPRHDVHGLPAQKDGTCGHPFMMINDLGKTFGTATISNGDKKSAVNFQEWSKTPIWKDDRACVAQLSKSFTGSLEHPKISEGGRKFLSELLAQLTDRPAAGSVRGRALHEARSAASQSTIGSGCSSRSATRSRTPHCANPAL